MLAVLIYFFLLNDVSDQSEPGTSGAEERQSQPHSCKEGGFRPRRAGPPSRPSESRGPGKTNRHLSVRKNPSILAIIDTLKEMNENLKCAPQK